MKKIKTLSLLIIFFNISCANGEKNGFYKGYEIPTYSVISKSENIEIREYEPHLIAEVKVEGSRNEAARKGFLKLAGYIFGKNISKDKINMTSPVSQKVTENNSEKIAMTSPVNQLKSDKNQWLVQFGMPKKYTLKTLPKPQNEEIKFKVLAKRKVAAISFSGFWTDKKFNQNSLKLKDFINEQGFKIKSEPILSYYDDPFTLPWNRRNEVIYEID